MFKKLVAGIGGGAVVGGAEVELEPHHIILKGTELGGDPGVILGQSAGIPAGEDTVPQIDAGGGLQPCPALPVKVMSRTSMTS